MNNIKVNDKVKLKNTRNWKGWGFENSTVIKVGKTLVQIRSVSGHTMYVKPTDIEHK